MCTKKANQTRANTPATCILCLMVFQTWCYLSIKNVPNWLSIILILLSNDVHLNPGPQYKNIFFNFMSWSVNSMAKDNFQRVRLIEAHNSIFNYDLISICETSLNDSVELPETLLNDYTFASGNNLANTRHGGVGLFYKKSLPAKIRDDLSFDEGEEIDELFSKLGLSQIISEPTNFEPHKKPSCIDHIVTNQPNIILESGTRASLDSFCHH